MVHNGVLRRFRGRDFLQGRSCRWLGKDFGERWRRGRGHFGHLPLEDTWKKN